MQWEGSCHFGSPNRLPRVRTCQNAPRDASTPQQSTNPANSLDRHASCCSDVSICILIIISVTMRILAAPTVTLARRATGIFFVLTPALSRCARAFGGRRLEAVQNWCTRHPKDGFLLRSCSRSTGILHRSYLRPTGIVLGSCSWKSAGKRGTGPGKCDDRTMRKERKKFTTLCTRTCSPGSPRDGLVVWTRPPFGLRDWCTRLNG